MLHFDSTSGQAPLSERVLWLARRSASSIPYAIGQRRIGRRYRLNDGFERVYLHHTRKTGGTSLSESFLTLGGEDPLTVKRRMRDGWQMARTGDFVVTAHHRRALRRGCYFFGWSHFPAWSVRLPNRTFTVTILRDPEARVLSLYRYLLDPRADADQPFAAPARERQSAADGFDRFLDRLAVPELLGQLQMFSRRRDPEEAAAGIEGCSLAFPVDRMEEGLATLSKLIGRRLSPRHERRSVASFEPSDAQRSRLREALEPEYALMGLLRL